MKPRLLDLCGCEGGAAMGYMRAGWHVTSVDLDRAALKHNPADVTVHGDALAFLADHGCEYDAIHASFPCQRWTANGANPAASKWPDLITPGRELLEATGRPWVLENVPKSPLRRVLVLCGTQFGLRAEDEDGTTLHLRRHRVFESNVRIDTPPGPCRCLELKRAGVQWVGVYGGARKDKHEARHVRKGGYVPPDPQVQSELLGGGAVDDRQGTARVHPADLRAVRGDAAAGGVGDGGMSEKGPSRSCGCDLFAPGHVEPHVDPILFIEHGERAYDDPLPHDVPGTGGWNGLYHESPDAYCLCGHPNYVTCERRKGWGLADLTLHNVGGAFVSTLPDTTADRGSAPEPTGDLRLTSPSGVCAVCARAVTGSRRLCGACAARRAS